jgi:hypothetical protein
MAYTAPGNFNTFPPQYVLDEAGAALATEFSRDPNGFEVNEYSELRPVEKRAGYYPRISPDAATRLKNLDGRHARWKDGDDRPNFQNNISFENENFRCERYNIGATLGDMTIDQADFLVEAINQRSVAQDMMTLRTSLAWSRLNAAAWGNNTGSVDGTFGTPGAGITLAAAQNWTNGSRIAPNIKSTLLKACSIINLATGGALRLTDFCLVANPNTAIGMATSAEIYDTPAQSQFAMDLIKGTGDFQVGNDQWGLPPTLQGIRICIDKTVYNSVGFGAASNPNMGYVIPDGTAFLLYRPKGKNVIERPDGRPYSDEDKIPVLSTLVCFAKEDFTVEAFPDPRNRRLEIDVVSDVDYQLSSPLSGFKFTHCLGV